MKIKIHLGFTGELSKSHIHFYYKKSASESKISKETENYTQ